MLTKIVASEQIQQPIAGVEAEVRAGRGCDGEWIARPQAGGGVKREEIGAGPACYSLSLIVTHCQRSNSQVPLSTEERRKVASEDWCHDGNLKCPNIGVMTVT